MCAHVCVLAPCARACACWCVCAARALLPVTSALYGDSCLKRPPIPWRPFPSQLRRSDVVARSCGLLPVMTCFEDDPCCFGFIFFGAIFLLVGAGLSGSGSTSSSAKTLAGYVLLGIAGLLITAGLLYFAVRTCQRRRHLSKGESQKRRSRKKLAELPLAVPVSQPVPHWVVYPSGASNPGLEEDYPGDSERQRPIANGYPRSVPLRASPMAHSATTGDLIATVGGDSERRSQTSRRNSIPSDPYEALWQYRQGQAPKAGGSFFALVSMPDLCDQHQGQHRAQTGHPGHPGHPSHHQQEPQDSPCFRAPRPNPASPAWRPGAYAVSPPVFV